MTIKSRVTLKSYLETDDMPTQAQFIDLVDSSPNISDDGIILGGDSAVTAFNGGGQANATLLVNQFNTVSVCVAPADSIKLPVCKAGNMFAVVNATANSCNIYPAAGQQIMALGVDAPQAIAAGEVFIFGSNGVGWAGGKLS